MTRRDRLRLIRTEGVGPVTYRRLLERYRTPAAALDALPRLARAAGRQAGPAVMSVGEAERELDRTRAAGGRLVFLGDADYPKLLALMDDAPPCLILHGDAALAQLRCVAAVGGRNASANGQRMAETLAAELAQTVVVVSGLARGIDTAAHHRRHAHRPDHRGDRRRDRPALSAGERRPAPPHRRHRSADHRSVHRHRAPGPPLPAPQPHHRRPVAGRGGGGGGAAVRQPDHRPLRAGGGPGSLRCSRLAARSRGPGAATT